MSPTLVAREELKKHKPATSKTTIMANCETELLGMLRLFQNKRKVTSDFFNSEDVEVSVDGGSFMYTKLHDHLRVSFSPSKNHAPFSFKQKSEISGNSLFDSNQLCQNFIWREQTALLVILDKN